MTGREVRDLRARLGMTQEQAAKMVGISRQGWQKWEIEERDCDGTAHRLLTLLRIGRVTNVRRVLEAM